ncbi:MAG: hypothetical protein GC137_00875 [Alphaproteobacteria bacterium]|nr:hypothetical protein [Alphaproteobacteria bacterium]
MSDDKAGSPPCGIYIRISDFSNMLDAIGWVRKMAFVINRSSGYEKNMSAVELVYTNENEDRLRDLIPIIQDNGLVAIVSRSFDPLGADGVLLENIEDVEKAREALDDDAIIGVVCQDRETADKAIAHEVDYVSLPADPVFIREFSAKTEIVCLAAGKDINPENCGVLAQSGAGLVDVGDYILNHEKDIMQGTVNILHALETTAQMPKTVN